MLNIKNYFTSLKHEIFSHKVVYCLLFFVLSASLFFRLYKLHEFLGFWYDQGRDALVIWRLFHERKFFLIGPVTGIEGIFLGPFYYFLIAPFYYLGKGSPIFVIAALNWLAVGGLLVLYLVGKELFNRWVGLLAVVFYGLSFSTVTFSRWLANPQPLPFFSLLIVYCLLKIYQGRERYWLLTGLLVGLSLQIEAAGAVFFLPAILGMILAWRKKTKDYRLIWLGLVVFMFTLTPQIFFNFRHQGILFLAFKKFLLTEKSFRFSLWQVVQSRILTYYDVFFGKLFPSWGRGQIFSATLFGGLLVLFWKKIFDGGKSILWWWFLIPLLGFLFYQGNFGYVWDYYFAGVIPIFILIFTALLFFLFKRHFWGKVIFVVFLICFGLVNGKRLVTYYQTGIGIKLKSQLWAIDWIYEDAKGENFNVDVYVPPVIPYAYDYLFKWYGGGKYGLEPLAERVDLLYTLAEEDPSHPNLFSAWFERQDGIGKVIKEDFYGNIIVQRRKRLP